MDIWTCRSSWNTKQRTWWQRWSLFSNSSVKSANLHALHSHVKPEVTKQLPLSEKKYWLQWQVATKTYQCKPPILNDCISETEQETAFIDQTMHYSYFYLRIAVSKVNQASQCNEWMSESFIWSNPLVWINNQSSLQQICKFIPSKKKQWTALIKKITVVKNYHELQGLGMLCNYM